LEAQRNEYLARGDIKGESRKCWHGTCTTTGVRIASSSTTTQTGATANSLSAGSSKTSFQAALTDLSNVTSFDGRLVGEGSKSNSGSSVVGRTPNKQDTKQGKTQSPSNTGGDTAAASAPVASVDQRPVPVQGSPCVQQTDDCAVDGASESAAPVPAAVLQVNSAPQGLAREVSSRTTLGATEHALLQQPLSVTAGGDKNADEVAGEVMLAQGNPNTAAQASNAGLVQAAGDAVKVQVESATLAAIANRTDSVQSVGKGTLKGTTDAPGSKSSVTTAGSDAGKAKGTDSAGVTAQGDQNNGQTMQHPQSDPALAAAATQKVSDGTGIQAQMVPIHTVIHEATTPVGVPSGVQDGTHPGVERGDTVNPLDGDEQASTSGINAAKLIQTMSDTEMRVGMHSSEFGNISIRTSVSQQQMLAQISLEHSDLSQAISAHIASVETKLGNDYGLQTLIQVNHQAATSSGEQGSAQREKQNAFASSARGERGAGTLELDVGMNVGALSSAGDRYRLDIRA
jgi:hypothetical protein